MAGCASCADPRWIKSTIERRSASARPMLGRASSSAKAFGVSFTAATELTYQCETRSARLGIEERACQPGEGLGIAFLSGRRVASGEHHPVGVESKLCH